LIIGGDADLWLWPVEFHDVMLAVMERLNEEPNFVAYVVSSFNHMFLSRSRYFDATEHGKSRVIVFIAIVQSLPPVFSSTSAPAPS
jgi:hypothetical protein